jgi:hypothetical protein
MTYFIQKVKCHSSFTKSRLHQISKTVSTLKLGALILYINLYHNFKESKVHVRLYEEEQEEIIILLSYFLCNIHHKYSGKCNTDDVYVEECRQCAEIGSINAINIIVLTASLYRLRHCGKALYHP